MNLPSKLKGAGPFAAAGLAGFLWFLARFGPSALNPTHLDWVMSQDWAQHTMGWLFFRNEPWQFPLGNLASYAYPMGSTLGFTDSNPWVSLLLKPFSGHLPADFQFIGPWLCLCFVLQGVAGAALVACFTSRPLHQLLGGILFVLSPALNSRTGHDSLCAHFALILLLGLYLRPFPEGGRPALRLAAACALVLFTAGTHPTLWAMALALVAPLLWKFVQEKRLSPKQGVSWGAGMLAGSAAIFAALGYLTHADQGAAGFGEFSADLLSLVNPMGFSRLLPDLPFAPAQHEGRAYLGLGTLLLLSWALVVTRGRNAGLQRSWATLRPLLVAVALCTLFAFSERWCVAGFPVLGLRWLYRPFHFLTAPFRSSGRFIWPLHYLAMAAAIAWALRLSRARPAQSAFLLSGAVAIQLVDLPRMAVNTQVPREAWYSLGSPALSELAQGKSHLVLYPRQLSGNSRAEACPTAGKLPENLHVSAGYFAYRHRMTVNSAYLARMDRRAAEKSCGDLQQAISQGKLDTQALYLVSSADLPSFEQAGAQCRAVDGLSACVAGPTPAPSVAHQDAPLRP